MIKTNCLGDGVPKENSHYTCIACRTFDSVIKIEKKNIHNFIVNTKLEKYKCQDLSTLN